MAKSIQQSGKAKSVPGGMALAACVSMLMTFTASAVIANSLNRERITWGQAGYWIMGMLFMASFLSGKCAFWAIKRQRIAVSLMSGLLYWGMLLCMTALFFGGNFSAVWETAGIIVAGCGTSTLVSMPVRRKRGIKRGRVYR